MIEVLMPRFDPDSTPATLLRWLAREGEQVAEGQPLAMVECDKTTLELEAFAAGRLVERCVAAGETVPPFALLARLEELS